MSNTAFRRNLKEGADNNDDTLGAGKIDNLVEAKAPKKNCSISITGFCSISGVGVSKIDTAKCVA
jgi:hypothetical protein